MIDLIAKRLWPLFYIFIKPKLSKRCKKCVLSERYIELNDNQICKLCQTYNTTENTPNKDNCTEPVVDSIISSYTGKGKKWDALVLFSGGKDSSLLIWKLQKNNPNLRIMALLVDTGFMSPIALQNAENVMNKFDVDYLKIRPNPKFTRNVFKFAFKNISKQKNYSVVDLLDGQIIFDSARNFAVDSEIPLIICGLAKNQVHNVFGPIGPEFLEEHETNPVVTQLNIQLNEAFRPEDNQYWFDRSQLGEKKAPRFILPMVEWDLPEEEIVKIVDENDLIPSKYSSPLLTNNGLIPLISIAEINTFGHTSFEIEFAKTVREGKAPRQYWVRIFQLAEYSALTGRLLSKSIDRVLKQLNLSRNDIGLT